jgi:flagellar biosynthesis protein FlhG
MRPESPPDQADGLRRLLLRGPARVILVAAARARMGATTVTINLAAALAQTGKKVLVLDENQSPDDAARMLALDPRHDLLDAVHRGKGWRDIALHPREGVRVIPAARAIRSLPLLPMLQREVLLATLAEASRGADIALVDTALCAGTGPVSSALAPDQPLLLVLTPAAASITESYALVKRMAVREGRESFLVVVNMARCEREARTVAGNIERVARQRLRVRVEYLGFIPVDKKLERATQLRRPVVEAFPAAAAVPAFEEIGRRLMLLPGAGDKEAASLPDVVRLLMGRPRSEGVALAA